MMKRITSNYHHLQVLKTAKPQLRKVIIKNCDSELVKAISECVLNVLHDNVMITPWQKKLRKFRGKLRAIADMRVSFSQETAYKSARRVPHAAVERNLADRGQSYFSFA